MDLVKRFGLPDLAAFAVVVAVGVVGATGRPGWITSEQLISGLLTLIAGLIGLVYFRLTKDLDERLPETTGNALESLLRPRSEWLRSGGIVSFDALQRSDVEVLVVGVSCINFLSANEADLREAVRQGASFRFVVADPTANFLGLYDVNMPNHSLESELRSDIHHALERIKRIDAKGTVKCRFYQGIPMFSALWFRNRSEDSIFIEFYTFGGSPSNRPGFFVSRETSTSWHRFFARSLDMLWDASKSLPIDEDGLAQGVDDAQ